MSIYNNNNRSSRASSSINVTFRTVIDGVLDGLYVEEVGTLGSNTNSVIGSNYLTGNSSAGLFIKPLGWPNNEETVSASNIHWNINNLDAQGSDGTQTVNDIITDVIFEDDNEPGTLENFVRVYVVFNSNFTIPLEYANSIYTIELDLGGKSVPPPNTGRYVNICLVNDFADTVDVNAQKTVYNSGISSMTSSPTLQALWDQAFHNKTPLKYNDGVVFTPAEEGDALGEPISVYDSRQHHASQEYDSTTWDDPGYGFFNGAGMQVNRRKDVIHLGFNCPEAGVPIKIGTFKLKLNQDIYETSINNATVSGMTMLQQMNAGQRNRNALVNGWKDNRTTDNTQERFLFNSSPVDIISPSYDQFKPNSPLGLIPTFRSRFRNDSSGKYSDFEGGNETGVNWYDEEFDGPYAIGGTPRFYAGYIRNGLKSDPEIITNWGPDVGSVFVSEISNTHHGPEIAALEASGGTPLIAQDYISDLLGDMNIPYNNDNLLEVCKSILWWQSSLYYAADLYCWAMFPAFVMHNTARSLSSSVDRIVGIPINPNAALSITEVAVNKWVQTGWEAEAFQLGLISSLYSNMGWDDDGAYGQTILADTTSYLSNYVREIEFDVYFTDTLTNIELDAGQVNESGTPFKGFNPETGEAGEGITTMQEDGPPIISDYSFGLTTNICWNYMPHADIINLGGLANKTLLDQSEFGRSGKSLSRIKTFTNTTQPTTGAKDRLEIREVNLSLGSALGSAQENIIPPGGIPENQSDAIITVVGDAGAKFLVSIKENEFVEFDNNNPRISVSDITDIILNGGFYETIRFNMNSVYTIPDEGGISLKLPPIKAMVLSDGYRSFSLRVTPYRGELIETSDDFEVSDDPIPTVIKRTARKSGYKLTAGDTNFANLEAILYQYPNVSIDVNVTKHDGSAYVTNYEDTTQIPHFAYEGKPLGKALGAVSDITFLRDDEKSISFEIRIQKSGTFSINNEFISQEFELNKCSYNNSTTINHESEGVQLVVGMLVEGEGIPEGATITSIPNRDSFVISSATTGGSKDNETISLSFVSLNQALFAPQIEDNDEKVHFSHLVAHVGNGLSNTESNYATLAGRIKYIQFGKRSQTFNIDLTKIFNHA